MLATQKDPTQIDLPPCCAIPLFFRAGVTTAAFPPS